MQSSIVLLACWILSLKLIPANCSIQLDEHHLSRRLHPGPGKTHSGLETKPALAGRQYAPTDAHSASAIESYASESSYASEHSEITSDEGYSGVASQAPTRKPSSTSVSQPATPSKASVPIVSSQASVLKVSPTPTCDKKNTKSEINRFLIECEAKLQLSANSISTYASQVTKENAQQLGSQISTRLSEIFNQLKLSLSNVQLCGTDANPLLSNNGIAISDVSWSAFQVVLTLKDAFQSITTLYKPFPVIESLCSDVLLTISTALASLIGACGEQINLFDTRFFPLVAPQLEEFTSLGDNFVSFVGTFES